MTDDLVLQPNVEALVVQFLRDQPEIAAIVGTRVFTEVPKDATWPLVRVHLFYERAIAGSRPLWLTAHDIQVEAFGGPKATAWQLAETCRAALAQRFEGQQQFGDGATASAGVVAGVNVTGLRDMPDELFSPAKPRFLFTATVFAHPTT